MSKFEIGQHVFFIEDNKRIEGEVFETFNQSGCIPTATIKTAAGICHDDVPRTSLRLIKS